MEHYEAIRRGEEMARLASSAELEVSDKGPTTSTVSLLTNLGLMALEQGLQDSHDAPVRTKPKWRICSSPNCQRAARGSSGLCMRHGGGLKCRHDGCTKSSRGVSGLCVLHGGGKRCVHVDENGTMACTSTARGTMGLCVKHGGGVECIIEGCTKAGRGSSRKCVSHGGGRRCGMADCMKAARGSSGYCVKHGGGARCQFLGCAKAARIRTSYCSTHTPTASSTSADTHDALPLPDSSSNPVHSSLPATAMSEHEVVYPGQSDVGVQPYAQAQAMSS